MLAGVCKRDDFSSVNEYCCCNDFASTGFNDEYCGICVFHHSCKFVAYDHASNQHTIIFTRS